MRCRAAVAVLLVNLTSCPCLWSARLEHWRAQRDKVSNKLQELVKKAATDEDQLAELFMQATKLLQRKQRKRREVRLLLACGMCIGLLTPVWGCVGEEGQDDRRRRGAACSGRSIVLLLTLTLFDAPCQQEVKRLLQHEYDLIKAAAPVRERAEAIVKLLADKKGPSCDGRMRVVGSPL